MSRQNLHAAVDALRREERRRVREPLRRLEQRPVHERDDLRLEAARRRTSARRRGAAGRSRLRPRAAYARTSCALRIAGRGRRRLLRLGLLWPAPRRARRRTTQARTAGANAKASTKASNAKVSRMVSSRRRAHRHRARTLAFEPRCTSSIRFARPVPVRARPRDRARPRVRGSRSRGAHWASRKRSRRDCRTSPVTVMGITFPESRRARRRPRQERRAPRRPRDVRLRLPRGRHRDAAPAAGQSEAAHVPPAASARAHQPARASTTTASTALVANVERARYRGVLGINIGKNFDTPNERAADDYVACLRAVYAKAHYVTVNVSSPNTQGLARPAGRRRARRAACARSSASRRRWRRRTAATCRSRSRSRPT